MLHEYALELCRERMQPASSFGGIPRYYKKDWTVTPESLVRFYWPGISNFRVQKALPMRCFGNCVFKKLDIVNHIKTLHCSISACSVASILHCQRFPPSSHHPKLSSISLSNQAYLKNLTLHLWIHRDGWWTFASKLSNL